MVKDKYFDEDVSHAWGTASLVLGIVGLCLFLAPYLGIVLSILAVIFYGRQKRLELTGQATAGLVLGIIGIVVNAIMLIFVVLALIILGSL